MMLMIQMLVPPLSHQKHVTQDFQDFLRVRLALANEYKATETNAEKQTTKRKMGKNWY